MRIVRIEAELHSCHIYFKNPRVIWYIYKNFDKNTIVKLSLENGNLMIERRNSKNNLGKCPKNSKNGEYLWSEQQKY